MKKDIKDYLHLYLGCKCKIGDSDKEYVVKMINGSRTSVYTGSDYIDGNEIPVWWKLSSCKPLLRPLSSMTEEENKRWKAKMHKQYSGGAGHTGYLENPESFRYLLSIGIDLFGLIDSGLAVTAETLK